MSTDEYLTHIAKTDMVGVQCLPGATVLNCKGYLKGYCGSRLG